MTKKTDIKMSRYTLKFRRRREGKTDYRGRLALLKSGMPRAVVRRTNTKIVVQIVAFDSQGDTVKAQANGFELKQYGWSSSYKNTPAAYLVGYLAGARAKKEGIEECVLDLGLARAVAGARVFAALKGLVDAGVAIEHDEKVLPSEERIVGKHVKNADNFTGVKSKISEQLKIHGGS